MRKLVIGVVALVLVLVGGVVKGVLSASMLEGEVSRVVQEPNSALLGKHSCTMLAGCSMKYDMIKTDRGYGVHVDFMPSRREGQAVYGWKRFVIDGDKMSSDGWTYFGAPITIYTRDGKVYLQWNSDPGVVMSK